MGKSKKRPKGFTTQHKKISSKIIGTSTQEFQKEQEALVFINQGKFQEAELIYKELILMGTRNPIVYSNLAAIYGKKGNHKEKILLLKEALKINPNYLDAHNNLGNALLEDGKLVDAIASFQKAISLNPNYLHAHYNLGNAFLRKGDLIDAISSFKKAIYIHPNFPNSYSNLGVAQLQNGDTENAILSFKKAIYINSNFPDAHCNLGIALKKQNDFVNAIEAFQEAIKLKPNYPEAHNNLGNALHEQGALITAIKAFRQAIKLKPNYPEAFYNLGISLHAKGEVFSAISAFQEAIKLKPNYPIASLNLSCSQLLIKDFQNGWDNYEWRWKTDDAQEPHAQPQSEKWHGELMGLKEHLLVVSEQGLGDTLQFMRYIPYLSRLGIDVSFCAQTKLHSLIQVSGIHSHPLTPEEANEISESKWIPLLSLPKYLEVRGDNPIITEPYIFTKEKLINKWKKILQNEKKPIIGINWQGNPNTEKNNLKGRSLSLEYFSSLVINNQFSFLSLQKGFGSEQLDNCSFQHAFVSCQKNIDVIWDFLEIAAIIINCDIIITSDTSVAHLAGGLGKQTFLLLQDVPDWRWGLKDEKIFWYPSIKLFRQKEKDNWQDLMERVSIELNRKFIP